jgi:predicted secreted Zn-dependent protease
VVLRARLVDLAGVLVALVCAGAANAAVTEEHIQQPYPVRALPGETLRKALNAATPITVDGQRFHGYTRWNVRWTFRWWREASGSCAITEVTTRLRTEVQLPELRSGTPAQQAVFDRYLRALSHHEEGHVRFGRDAAQAIDQGIAALPAAPDCATLERQANALGHRLLREHAEREKQYDRDTRHGASQGARLE